MKSERNEESEGLQPDVFLIDLPALEPDDEDDEDEPDFPMEEGDRIFVTALETEAEDLCATSTHSQRLAEAFKRNSTPVDQATTGPVPSEEIPAHLREFSAVFSKESFDALPNPKPWDHANPSRPWNETTRSMIRKCSLSYEQWKSGDTS
jgi:hypothetical protein